MKAVPTVRALFLCQAVIFEDRTRNVSLITCFSRFRVPEFPAAIDPFFVYARLINGRGTVTLRVTIDRLDTMATVYTEAIEYTFPDRIAEVDFKLRVTGCSLPRSGRYSANLYADRELIAQTEFEALAKEG